jgi:radical SAM protein with 4Fe4S-binding SPASM domain
MPTPAYDWQPGQDYQVLDMAEGAALLFITGNHRLLRVTSELGERLRDGLHALSPEELEEWSQLVENDVISDVNRHRLAASSFSDGANLAINVNLTAICNLGCTYCFADGGDYGRIKGKMEAETVDYIFAFIRQHVTPSQTVRFEFFGGEPLLNFDRIREICERSEQVHKTEGIDFIYRISTNLTVLPPGTLELFTDKKFIVSVSIDGGADTHDRNRPTKGGHGSFDTIINNCLRVRRACDDITMVARMTVVSDQVSLTENVRTLWDYNIFDYFQIYPGVVPAEKNEIFSSLVTIERHPTKSVTPKASCSSSSKSNTVDPTFYRQLRRFFEFYPSLFTQTNRFRGVLEYERLADMIVNGKLALSYCSGGRNYYTFSPDDSIMPCHRLVGETEFQTGNGEKGLTDRLDPWRLSVDEHPTCSKCWIRYLCGGGCKQENFVATGSLTDPNPEMCKSQIQLVESVVQVLTHQDATYRERNRVPLEDLFVSCGRPLIMNLRPEGQALPTNLQYFQIL